VREALVSSGHAAVAPLVAALASSSSSATAAGAALVLGELRARDGLRPIVHGMQRGAVPLRFGLRALAALGAPEALPTVLELLDDADPSVRMEAIAGAIALLDPAHVDGRAIDPATVALRDPATPEAERVQLVRLLGRTGAPRAQEILLSLATAKAPALRLAVLEALGEIRAPSAKVDGALMAALDDDAADVRLAAAMALSRVASPSAAPRLLDRLMTAAEQDRGALGVALSGALARVKDDAVATKVGEALEAAPDAARDALIEGLGRMPGKAALGALETLASRGIDDRRKLAEALAGHAEATALLRKLAQDPDSGVRANAVWSLGHVGRRDDAKVAIARLADPDAAVAGNAAATLGRIAAREKDPAIAAPLCAVLGDAQSYVRADALVGLTAAKASCPDPSIVLALVARDPSDVVRVAAADYARVAAALAPKPERAEPFLRALRRCAGEDRDATVAERCASGPPEAGPEIEDVGVFVVPDGRNVPLARSAFALVRTDGFLRLGLADRRGEIFELAVPRGTLRLAVPAPLAR
jgi:HEAT repeat protein